MEYRNLVRTGFKVWSVCSGTIQFGWTTDEKTMMDVIDAFMKGRASLHNLFPTSPLVMSRIP
jgi:aryl-alcohol dehydrogenase-like predicted oxidoreductase